MRVETDAVPPNTQADASSPTDIPSSSIEKVVVRAVAEADVAATNAQADVIRQTLPLSPTHPKLVVGKRLASWDTGDFPHNLQWEEVDHRRKTNPSRRTQSNTRFNYFGREWPS